MEFSRDNFDEYRWVKFMRLENQMFISDPRKLSNSFDEMMDEMELKRRNKSVCVPEHNSDCGYMILRNGNVFVFDDKFCNKEKVARSDTLRYIQRIGERVKIQTGSMFPDKETTGVEKLFFGEIGQRGRHEYVRELQDGYCADCGETTEKFQVHHRLPESLDGISEIENLIGLCGHNKQTNKFKNSCHEKWNNLAKVNNKEEIIDNRLVFPGVPMIYVPGYFYKKMTHGYIY